VNDLRTQLEKEEGQKTSDSPLGLIVAELARINKIYRCPIVHPEMVLNAKEAKQVFELASIAISALASNTAERQKLKKPAPAP
jgi:hypothetical protein